jgi:hypothetical protein
MDKDILKNLYMRLKLFLLGIKFERFSAIVGKKYISKSECNNVGISAFRSPGAYGNFLSIREIIKDAKKNNYKNIMILEDDVFFHKDFINRFRKEVDTSCDIVWLGGNQGSWKGVNIKDGRYKPNDTTWGFFGVVLHKNVYDTLLFEFDKNKLASDVALNRVGQVTNSYVIHPALLIPDVTFSSTSGMFRSNKNFLKSRMKVNSSDYSFF